MKKHRILLPAIFLAICASANAGPFGLSMGMKKEAFTGDLEKVSEMIYTAKKVPTPSSFIKEYNLVFSPTKGLAKILCTTDRIKTSVYGDGLISEFEKLENALTQKYGTPKKYDFLRSGSIWNEPRDWMMALVKEERTLAAGWSSTKENPLPDSIGSIVIKAIAVNDELGYISISYEFSNWDVVIEEMRKQKSDGL